MTSFDYLHFSVHLTQIQNLQFLFFQFLTKFCLPFLLLLRFRHNHHCWTSFNPNLFILFVYLELLPILILIQILKHLTGFKNNNLIIFFKTQIFNSFVFSFFLHDSTLNWGIGKRIFERKCFADWILTGLINLILREKDNFIHILWFFFEIEKLFVSIFLLFGNFNTLASFAQILIETWVVKGYLMGFSFVIIIFLFLFLNRKINSIEWIEFKIVFFSFATEIIAWSRVGMFIVFLKKALILDDGFFYFWDLWNFVIFEVGFLRLNNLEIVLWFFEWIVSFMFSFIFLFDFLIRSRRVLVFGLGDRNDTVI